MLIRTAFGAACPSVGVGVVRTLCARLCSYSRFVVYRTALFTTSITVQFITSWTLWKISIHISYLMADQQTTTNYSIATVRTLHTLRITGRRRLGALLDFVVPYQTVSTRFAVVNISVGAGDVAVTTHTRLVVPILMTAAVTDADLFWEHTIINQVTKGCAAIKIVVW